MCALRLLGPLADLNKKALRRTKITFGLPIPAIVVQQWTAAQHSVEILEKLPRVQKQDK